MYREDSAPDRPAFVIKIAFLQRPGESTRYLAFAFPNDDTAKGSLLLYHKSLEEIETLMGWPICLEIRRKEELRSCCTFLPSEFTICEKSKCHKTYLNVEEYNKYFKGEHEDKIICGYATKLASTTYVLST